jgi:phosphoenolpyruvate carboxykinase (GTP)
MDFRLYHQWIQEIASLCQPQSIYYCTGSSKEYESLCEQLVNESFFIRLNPHKRPQSFLCRSDPNDVARLEEFTFICSATPEEAGPTNHWHDPFEMAKKLKRLFTGCMRGRILYVVPFSMGPVDSPFSILGVELTDSPYVVCHMHLMTRMGPEVNEAIQKRDFIPCIHSVGKPLVEDEIDTSWPCNQEKYIVHFPESREIWSYGSGYGGNALLGKKCLSLRLGSVIGRQEGWLAEHMLIIGVTNPQGEKIYIAAAFPSACGKTHLAMLDPTIPGWKIETVGDDIAWMRIGKDGRLYAMNPEAGFFGVAPGLSTESNPYAHAMLSKDVIFTNVALTNDGDVWWEGMTETAPSQAVNWLTHAWNKDSPEKAAQPNARFTTPLSQCPILDSEWNNPEGVPISAILFGGRRATNVPLVYEAFDWEHGVFIGATLSSETTAAAVGNIGQLRHDPFAMLPFCGYHMGDYFNHWLQIGKACLYPPIIYGVNWFRKGKEDKYLWPGFNENIRILKWIFERTSQSVDAIHTPLGYIPNLNDLDINPNSWLTEIEEIHHFFTLFENRLPFALHKQCNNVKKMLLKLKESYRANV